MCFSNFTITHSAFSMNYFKVLFESISDYRKIVLLTFLFQNDKNLLQKIGLSECNIERLNLEFNNILSEQIDEYQSYDKNPEETIIERFLNK